ncbi:hypothetical protein HPG69_003292 [Diceros bicornis minor]|uniref:Uncharacterized protein n=1 Tax=Diceros bicornis minor TaxID=77932 RepID=A0A7J7E8F5_DICBM|nr:hypothetical protein HPG69_003292 [Diceros bicornis minor]
MYPDIGFLQMRIFFSPLKMKAEHFHGDGAESEEGRLAARCPCPPKAAAKAKALKAKKAALKGVPSGKKKRSTRHPPSGSPRHCGAEGSSNIL